MTTRNARLGLRLFAAYSACYAAFVFVNAFIPTAMEATPIGGVNSAILSGAGLIALALVVAAVYGVLAGGEDPATTESPVASEADE